MVKEAVFMQNLSNILAYTLATFSTNLPQFWGSQISLIFVLSQQLLQFNYLQFKSTYKTGSITASLLLLTSLFYYHVVTYKQITVDFMIYDQFIKTLLQRSVEL